MLGGNERAFAAIYRRYARYVAGVAYRLLGNDAEVDDVVQETFCDASGALATLRDGELLRPWLARICVSRVHKRLSKRKRWNWLLGEAKNVVPTVSDPRGRAPADALHEILQTLPAELRMPWILHCVEGESLPDVASMCEVSLATAKRRIAKATEKIEGGLRANG